MSDTEVLVSDEWEVVTVKVELTFVLTKVPKGSNVASPLTTMVEGIWQHNYPSLLPVQIMGREVDRHGDATD